MKKLGILSILVAIAIGVNAQNIFDKGSKKIDLTIGIGSVRHLGATFDQHVNMEWGVAKIGDKFTIGVGFAVNNSYGGVNESTIYGEYDYTYSQTYTTKIKNSHNRWVQSSEKKDVKREGYGSATANVGREDFNTMLTASFHYSPIKKLDTYAKIGLGVGCKTYVFNKIRNENGFKEANIKDKKILDNSERKSWISYSYNDLDNVEWQGYKAKVAASMALYVGATYYITDNWGIDTQIGMISSNLEGKYYPNSFGIFAVGASYKF
ncbi:MAG: hypothetical protein IKV14_01530 [Muribaculaceae bacterium]|nr:hypothetical protein [Muribaculaceae bacterium]